MHVVAIVCGEIMDINELLYNIRDLYLLCEKGEKIRLFSAISRRKFIE